MFRRISAAITLVLLWAGLVWFTAWDTSPADWRTDTRFAVALIGALIFFFAATFPLFDED